MATSEEGLVPAAQYVRMSTEHQRYSTLNQKDRIHEYALAHGLEVVKTYADEGKSGLRLKGRTALQRLLMDVASGNAGYQCILVYDVSRWGRFQDADESAHYEFLCRRAGIQVQYCAEQFPNDGSPMSCMVKGIKRIMAGEYSRELSVKVFAGQARLARMGYSPGGVAPYGLRRLVVDERGQRKDLLSRGERKSFPTDRVVFVPGPANEVDVVRTVYHWFTEERLTRNDIARRLTASGILPPWGDVWFGRMVTAILRNPKYIGDVVFNRRSNRLGTGQAHNAEAQWIVHRDAHPPLIDRATFDRAQVRLGHGKKFTDEELLDGLRTLYHQRGDLNCLLIQDAGWLPTARVFSKRFGSLKNAGALVGCSVLRHRPIDSERAHVSRRYLAAYALSQQRKLSMIGARTEMLAYSTLLILGVYRVCFQRLPQGYMTALGKNVECVVLFHESQVLRESCCYVIPSDAGFARTVQCNSRQHLQQLARFEVFEEDLAHELKALALRFLQRLLATGASGTRGEDAQERDEKQADGET